MSCVSLRNIGPQQKVYIGLCCAPTTYAPSKAFRPPHFLQHTIPSCLSGSFPSSLALMVPPRPPLPPSALAAEEHDQSICFTIFYFNFCRSLSCPPPKFLIGHHFRTRNFEYPPNTPIDKDLHFLDQFICYISGFSFVLYILRALITLELNNLILF